MWSQTLPLICLGPQSSWCLPCIPYIASTRHGNVMGGRSERAGRPDHGREPKVTLWFSIWPCPMTTPPSAFWWNTWVRQRIGGARLRRVLFCHHMGMRRKPGRVWRERKARAGLCWSLGVWGREQSALCTAGVWEICAEAVAGRMLFRIQNTQMWWCSGDHGGQRAGAERHLSGTAGRGLCGCEQLNAGIRRKPMAVRGPMVNSPGDGYMVF